MTSSVPRLNRTTVLHVLRAQNDPGRMLRETLAAWVIVLSGTLLFTIIATVLSSFIANRLQVVVLSLLPIGMLTIVSFAVLYSRDFHLRRQPPTGVTIPTTLQVQRRQPTMTPADTTPQQPGARAANPESQGYRFAQELVRRDEQLELLDKEVRSLQTHVAFQEFVLDKLVQSLPSKELRESLQAQRRHYQEFWQSQEVAPSDPPDPSHRDWPSQSSKEDPSS